jgi:hypothetical protein
MRLVQFLKQTRNPNSCIWIFRWAILLHWKDSLQLVDFWSDHYQNYQFSNLIFVDCPVERPYHQFLCVAKSKENNELQLIETIIHLIKTILFCFIHRWSSSWFMVFPPTSLNDSSCVFFSKTFNTIFIIARKKR